MKIPKNVILALLTAMAGLTLQAKVISPLINYELRNLLITKPALVNLLRIVVVTFMYGFWLFITLYVLQEFRKYK